MGTDVVNIADLNDNADIIDQQLKENKDAVDTKETPAGAQAKADSAETKAKAYADSITPAKVSQLTNDKGYIAASGAPVQSVNGKTGAVSLTAANVGAASAAHANDTTKHITSAERSAWNAKPGSQRAVSDSISSTSSSVAASSKAVKTAYNKGVSAYNLANTKEAAFSKNSGFNLPKSNSVSSSSSSQLATSVAVKTAYDRANQAFQSASDGKQTIATAITGKGGTASGSDTFSQLANSINNVASWNSNLKSENIKNGINIFGIVGDLEGIQYKAGSKYISSGDLQVNLNFKAKMIRTTTRYNPYDWIRLFFEIDGDYEIYYFRYLIRSNGEYETQNSDFYLLSQANESRGEDYQMYINDTGFRIEKLRFETYIHWEAFAW